MRNSTATSPTVINRFGAFIEGEHGLARTFWFDFVLTTNVLFFAIWFFVEHGSRFAIACLVAWFLYGVAALVAVWRAAGKYTGLSVWPLLARGVVLLHGVVFAVGFYFTLAAKMEDARTASAPLNSMQSSEPRGAPRPQASPNQVGGPVITGDQQALQDVATAAVARFPYLDTAQGAHALDLIMEERDRRIALGESPPAALAAAVNQIAPIYAPR